VQALATESRFVKKVFLIVVSESDVIFIAFGLKCLDSVLDCFQLLDALLEHMLKHVFAYLSLVDAFSTYQFFKELVDDCFSRLIDQMHAFKSKHVDHFR